MSNLAEGERLFSFAVVSDTHVNEAEVGSSSSFEVNWIANPKLRQVIIDLNSRDVDCVIHLGDEVHPVPSILDIYKVLSEQF